MAQVVDERMRAAHDTLIRLGMLIDKNEPLHGRTMWAPNPKLVDEQQLTEQQRKALIESDSTGSDLQEKLESAARFVNIDSRIDQSERAMKVWCRAYVVKFNELCAFLAAQYGFDPDPAKLSDQQRNRIAGEVEALTKKWDEAHWSNRDLEAKTELERLLAEHHEISERMRAKDPWLPLPKRPLFEAEVTFDDLSNARAAIMLLNSDGFDVEVLDWVDPYGTPFTWFIASCEPGQGVGTNDSDLRNRVLDSVKPLGGEVICAGTSPFRLKEYNDGEEVDESMPELRETMAIVRQRNGLAYQVYPRGDRP
jgi:hypothetical protein